MSPIDKEEFYKKALGKTIRERVKAYLHTKEEAQRYLKRDDDKKIKEKIDELSQKITNTFILKLKKKGYLDDKEPSEEEFSKLLKESVNELIKGENENNTK